MIEKNKNIKAYNTFMVPVFARYFAIAHDYSSLYQILDSQEWSGTEKKMVLGGGSNMLFTKDYDGFIIKNEIKGITIVHEDAASIIVRVGAGEPWHDFVMWSVERGYWGIENLVLIPGTVGGSPVQNIGAYGVEVGDSIDSIECISLHDGKKQIYTQDECGFGYRTSIFKQQQGGNVFITYVYFKLQKQGTPILHYGGVAEVCAERGITQPTPMDIARVIIDIRKSKLPDVGEIGMAGSFFKNPVVSEEYFTTLQKRFPTIPHFKSDDGIKIPAGWLLEFLGYKGFQDGNVGNYHKHALVVTHNGQGTGREVWDHVQNIIQKTYDRFGIQLEPEVNIV
jgi:UDP-N-acetylmuramate dehydrogenase